MVRMCTTLQYVMSKQMSRNDLGGALGVYATTVLLMMMTASKQPGEHERKASFIHVNV